MWAKGFNTAVRMHTSPMLSEFSSACAAIFSLSSSRICLCTALSSVLSPAHGFSTLKLLICIPRTATTPSQAEPRRERERAANTKKRTHSSRGKHLALLASHVIFLYIRDVGLSCGIGPFWSAGYCPDGLELLAEPFPSSHVRCTPFRSLYPLHYVQCCCAHSNKPTILSSCCLTGVGNVMRRVGLFCMYNVI